MAGVFYHLVVQSFKNIIKENIISIADIREFAIVTIEFLSFPDTIPVAQE